MDYTLILRKKYAGNEWTLNGEDYEGLVWLSETPKPTKKTLDSLWDEVIAEIKEEENAKANAKASLLERLGITEEEVRTLLS